MKHFRNDMYQLFLKPECMELCTTDINTFKQLYRKSMLAKAFLLFHETKEQRIMFLKMTGQMPLNSVRLPQYDVICKKEVWGVPRGEKPQFIQQKLMLSPDDIQFIKKYVDPAKLIGEHLEAFNKIVSTGNILLSMY